MDKKAQERGLLNKLYEKANLTGKLLERINPEFQETMDNMRATDEKIREHASQLKEFTRSSKSFLNRRDYLSSAVNLSAFHERCRYIAAELDKFVKSVNLKHYKFILDQFDDEQKQQLFGYDPSKQINVDVNEVADVIITASLKKKAGLSDWWFKITDPIDDIAHNLTTGKGRFMAALEKQFSTAFLQQLKSQSIIIVRETEKFLSMLLSTFKALATAVARRDANKYIEAAKKFLSRFAQYHQLFVNYYNKNIVPLKEQHQALTKAKEEADRLVEQEKSRKLEESRPKDPVREQRQISLKEEPASRPRFESLYEPGGDTSAPTITMPGQKPELKSVPKTPGPVQFTPLEMALNEEDEDVIDLDKRKSAQFISRLEKIASQKNVKKLVSEILLFSEEMEKISSQKSLQLISIAEGIMDDYKSVFENIKSEQANDNKQNPGNDNDPLA